ncbi:MAG TPA: hypothetical protein VMV10_02185 [Pirellulales bacterium]|nr:hypothetical protein [Pirellulales bacterium]
MSGVATLLDRVTNIFATEEETADKLYRRAVAGANVNADELAKGATGRPLCTEVTSLLGFTSHQTHLRQLEPRDQNPTKTGVLAATDAGGPTTSTAW